MRGPLGLVSIIITIIKDFSAPPGGWSRDWHTFIVRKPQRMHMARMERVEPVRKRRLVDIARLIPCLLVALWLSG